jgi:hypothetical protein
LKKESKLILKELYFVVNGAKKNVTHEEAALASKLWPMLNKVKANIKRSQFRYNDKMYQKFLNSIESSNKNGFSLFYKLMALKNYSLINGTLEGNVAADAVSQVIHDFYSKLYDASWIDICTPLFPVNTSYSIVQDISMNKLTSSISQIKKDKANGTDLISNNVLKLLSASALSYVLLFFNTVLKTKCIPES